MLDQSQTAAQLCRDAANLLRVHGHVKHTQFDRDGGMCIYGALGKARFDGLWDGYNAKADPVATDAEAAIMKHLGAELDPYKGTMWPLASWNNAPERTEDEVIAALEGAAESLSDVSGSQGASLPRAIHVS